MAGSFLCQTSHWLSSTPGNGSGQTGIPRDAAGCSQRQLLERLDDAMRAKHNATLSICGALEEALAPRRVAALEDGIRRIGSTLPVVKTLEYLTGGGK